MILLAQEKVLAEIEKASLTHEEIAENLPSMAAVTARGAVHKLIQKGLVHSIDTGVHVHGGCPLRRYCFGPGPVAEVELIDANLMLTQPWGRLPSNHSMAMASI